MKRLGRTLGFSVCVLFLLTFGFVSPAHATIYVWVDENGVLQLGHTPAHNMQPQVAIELMAPAAGYSQIEKQEEKTTQSKLDAPKKKMNPEQSENYTTVDVELYTTSWRHYCEKARAFFHGSGVAFSEYDIEADEEAASRKQELDGRPGVPFAPVNGQPIHGFLPQAYQVALESGP